MCTRARFKYAFDRLREFTAAATPMAGRHIFIPSHHTKGGFNDSRLVEHLFSHSDIARTGWFEKDD